MKNTLITIVGPTGIGKTRIAIAVAQAFNTEIISCDSRQFYKEMHIGTAVPSKEELSAVKHHFIQQLSIENNYSVGDFERDANAFMTNFFKQNPVLVMVGGSGLYEKAVTQGLDKFPEIPAEVRNQLNQEYDKLGLIFLQNELKQNDPTYYETADGQNPHRLIRALEVIRYTGQPFSQFLQKNLKSKKFNLIKIGLQLPRETVYERINQRVHKMMEEGLLEEVKCLRKYRNMNALQTVGYKELFQYLDGEITLEKAVEEIQKNTRRYAKRQLTWYRKDADVNWFSPFEKEKIIEFISHQIKK